MLYDRVECIDVCCLLYMSCSINLYISYQSWEIVFLYSNISFLFQPKRDDDQGVVLTRVYRSPDELASDQSDSSFSSPSHELYHKSLPIEEESVHSSSLTYSSSFGPIRSALSRSKQDLLEMDAASSPNEEVVFRRPRIPDLTNDSVSSGKFAFLPQSVRWIFANRHLGFHGSCMTDANG